MRDVSPEFLAAVRGSNTPVTVADVWLGSEIIRADVRIVGGQARWNADNAVEEDVPITLLDTESSGSKLKDIIHAYGCHLNIRAGFEIAGERELVSIGWFEIVETEAVENWQWYDWLAEDKPLKVSEVVQVRARGLMGLVAESGLISPTQPTPGSDAWAAIESLCLGVISVLDPGLPAKTLPTGASAITIDQERLGGIQKIADLWEAKPIITDQKQLTLVTPGSGDEVEDYGYRINISDWVNQTSSDRIRNGVEFRGRTPEGLELRGYAFEEDGPLAWGGPIGRRPHYERSDLMTTQAMVDAAAATTLARLIRERGRTQTVDALWNPAQQLRDRPRLVRPGSNGDSFVDAEIVGITLPLGAPPQGGGPMSATLRLPLLEG